MTGNNLHRYIKAKAQLSLNMAFVFKTKTAEAKANFEALTIYASQKHANNNHVRECGRCNPFFEARRSYR